ncbi:hypothetical protein R3I93_008278 [Phoxinus phoxinus]|uniref:Uncharacterized protein n=1 Tax=Phoxinus phoxinus TaxID=58324 RepID=A0AAN9D6L2_9TELE
MINTFCIALRRTNRKPENEKRKETQDNEDRNYIYLINYSSKVWGLHPTGKGTAPKAQHPNKKINHLPVSLQPCTVKGGEGKLEVWEDKLEVKT